MLGAAILEGTTMRDFIGFCGIGLIALATPSVSVAAGITYDCDTAADHFSELDLPAPNAPFTVTGTVQINATAGSAKYMPLARIQIATATAPGQSPNAFAGFTLEALAKQTASGVQAMQMLNYNVAGKDDELLPTSIVTKPGTPQPFRLSYDGSVVSVTLGNEAKSFSVRTTEPVVRLICSTGEFLFTNVVIQPSR
jgi:hypothetical protein